MIVATPKRFQFLALTVTLLGIAGCSPGADEASVPSAISAPEESSFDASDSDGDGMLDEAEVISGTVQDFDARDENADGVLEGDELQGIEPETISRIDSSRDGRLSLTETIRAKMSDFGANDLNNDGALSRDEATGMGRWP